jgi:hypothetical protein
MPQNLGRNFNHGLMRSNGLAEVSARVLKCGILERDDCKSRIFKSHAQLQIHQRDRSRNFSALNLSARTSAMILDTLLGQKWLFRRLSSVFQSASF